MVKNSQKSYFRFKRKKLQKTSSTKTQKEQPLFIYKDQASSALEVLGYARKNCDKILDKILKENPTLNTEQLIKEALKKL